MNKKVHELVTANAGKIVGEEYYPMDHMEYGETVEKITSSGADIVFNTIVPPGVVPFLQLLHDAGFQKRGGQLICTYFDENFLCLLPKEHMEGLYGCLDYYQNIEDPFSRQLLGEYNKRFPGKEQFTGGSACSGLIGHDAVGGRREGGRDPRPGQGIAALDHAKIAEGPGGPAEMVSGQHHVRMNMYIAQAKNGRFEIVEELGAIDPKEAEVSSNTMLDRRGAAS